MSTTPTEQNDPFAVDPWPSAVELTPPLAEPVPPVSTPSSTKLPTSQELSPSAASKKPEAPANSERKDLVTDLGPWSKFIFCGILALLTGWGTVWGYQGPGSQVPILLNSILFLFYFLFVLFTFACWILWLSTFLALFNSRPMVWVIGKPHPGGTLDLHWQFKPNGFKPKKLKFSLEVEETKQGQQSKVLYDETIFEAAGHEVRAGSAQLKLPGNFSHSRPGKEIKTVWTLTLHGAVPLWPDIEYGYEVTVVRAPVDLPFL